MVKFRCSYVPALLGLLVFAVTATAQVNLDFADGGRASGSWVFTQVPGPFGGVSIKDYRIVVSGGDETLFPPTTYDSTNSRVVSGGDPFLGDYGWIESLAPSCPGKPRKIFFRRGQAEENCGRVREYTDNSTNIEGTTLRLTANGHYPADHVVRTSGPISVKLQITRGNSTEAVDWYWAIQENSTLQWVGPAGLSTTPVRLARIAPFDTVQTLQQQTYPPSTVVTHWFIAVSGSTVVASDYITVVVDGPP